MSTNYSESFETVFDLEEVQAVILQAALEGNSSCLEKLPSLISVMDEPFRTVATLIHSRIQQGEFVDHNVLAGLVGQHQPIHCDANGHPKQLTASETMNLLKTDPVQPGQAEEYLDLLTLEANKRRRVEQKQQVHGLAEQFWDSPDRLRVELKRLESSVLNSTPNNELYDTSELAEIVPYMTELEKRQQGTKFQGFDSGFQHLNHICDGLNTGLFVFAAPPGEGKTTLAWQLACQVAAIESVPVIFVSLEQSKGELRDKALACLSHTSYRHIRRGQLKVDDFAWGKVLEAANKYALLGEYLTIIEGDDRTTVGLIRQIASQALQSSKASRCLIIIDYLQILRLGKEDPNRHDSSKDRVDYIVSSLRRLARDLDACVLAISSENRASYRNKSALSAFKESGGIEYSADIAAILSRGPHSDSPDVYRFQDLSIVKNRNGERGRIKLKFYMSQARFEETERDELFDEDGSTEK